MGASDKILTVSYGCFSCRIEGVDDPVDTFRMIAGVMGDLTARNRSFGSLGPTQARMLRRLAGDGEAQGPAEQSGLAAVPGSAAEALAMAPDPRPEVPGGDAAEPQEADSAARRGTADRPATAPDGRTFRDGASGEPSCADLAPGERPLGERALGERALGERALGDRAFGEPAAAADLRAAGPARDMPAPAPPTDPGTVVQPEPARLVRSTTVADAPAPRGVPADGAADEPSDRSADGPAGDRPDAAATEAPAAPSAGHEDATDHADAEGSEGQDRSGQTRPDHPARKRLPAAAAEEAAALDRLIRQTEMELGRSGAQERHALLSRLRGVASARQAGEAASAPPPGASAAMVERFRADLASAMAERPAMLPPDEAPQSGPGTGPAEPWQEETGQGTTGQAGPTQSVARQPDAGHGTAEAPRRGPVARPQDKAPVAPMPHPAPPQGAASAQGSAGPAYDPTPYQTGGAAPSADRATPDEPQASQTGEKPLAGSKAPPGHRAQTTGRDMRAPAVPEAEATGPLRLRGPLTTPPRSGATQPQGRTPHAAQPGPAPAEPAREDATIPMRPVGRGDDAGFRSFADAVGAEDLPDVIAAAAAYVATVEGMPAFSRRQVMHHAASVGFDDRLRREDGLRAFGGLLRQGRIVRSGRGRFTLGQSAGPGNGCGVDACPGRL